MTPSLADLAELGRKYTLLAALRRAKSADGTTPDRAFWKTLAERFPGVLVELDTLTLSELDTRAAELEEAARGGRSMPWMAWIYGYHALLRAALCTKARTTRDRDVSSERALTIARDVSRYAGVAVDEAFVRAVARPPNGRMIPIVYARLAAHFAVDEEVIADALFPRRRARRHDAALNEPPPRGPIEP